MNALQLKSEEIRNLQFKMMEATEELVEMFVEQLTNESMEDSHSESSFRAAHKNNIAFNAFSSSEKSEALSLVVDDGECAYDAFHTINNRRRLSC